MATSQVIVREVWKHNLDTELMEIHKCIFHYRIISIDTEFPGTVYKLPHKETYCVSPEHQYQVMKLNVDLLRLIQLGLTLMDICGNFPNLGTGFRFVWQFNFRDFDPEIHAHNSDSIKLLKSQGIRFSDNKAKGIDSNEFADKFRYYVLNARFTNIPGTLPLTWITFQGAYDFGYMIKILTRGNLPENLYEFMHLVGCFFGVNSYDVKLIALLYGLHGGLDKVAASLGLNRVGGDSCHQAGPDSLLTMQVFEELRKKPVKKIYGNNHKLYGLVHRSV